MTEELKPCPFCGEPAALYEAPAEAIAAWNQRAPVSEWQDINRPPTLPQAVIFHFGNIVWRDQNDEPVTMEPIREHVESMSLGFWDGECWRDAGTAHETFEEWRDSSDMPTHWMFLPASPVQHSAEAGR